MAKAPKKGGEDGGKRKPGRPPTGIATVSFCCRSPATLSDAFDQLAEVTGSKRGGTELLRAAEDHMVRMYRIIKADPDAEWVRKVNVPSFLAAAETYFKEAGLWPLPDA